MRAGALLAFGALLATAPLAAQEWRVGAQLGHISYNGALATGSDQPAVVLGLSRAGLSDWFGLSAGLPIGDQEFWAAVSSSRRIAVVRPLGLHLDLSAHAFAQHSPDSLTQALSSPPSLPNGGAATDRWFVRGAGAQAAITFAGRLGPLQLEARAGGAGRASSIAGEQVTEILSAADARLLLDLGALRLGPEAQQWRSTVTYAGGTARLTSGPGLLWASAGSWTRGGPTDVVWSLGGAVALGAGIRLEGSYRSPGYDPLYQSETAGSVSLGASIGMGGPPPLAAPVPAAYRNGRAVLRLRAGDVRGMPRIAGDFTDWQLVAMTRAGGFWTVSIPVEPGVYSYAFVNETGEWFVPESVPGRRSDGMGGWQAVLVVE